MTAVSFINITKGCNIHCDRCYLSKQSRSNFSALDESTLLQFLANPLIRLSSSPLFVWEGGEVVSTGIERLRILTEVVERVVVNPSQRCVTNLFHLPNKLIDLSFEKFDGRIETTFSNGGKESLSGSERNFNNRFKSNSIRALKEGLALTINVELNDHTIRRGIGAFLEVMSGLDGAHWEFDISCDFPEFRKSQSFRNSYPLIESTASYAEFWKFASDLKEGMDRLGLMQTHGLYSREFHSKSTQFNVNCGDSFFTLNPDGSVTTNPLYSDIPETMIGNVKRDSWDELLLSDPRVSLINEESIRSLECVDCDYFNRCGGGASHIPVHDNSGECVGGYNFRKRYDEQFLLD